MAKQKKLKKEDLSKASGGKGGASQASIRSGTTKASTNRSQI